MIDLSTRFDTLSSYRDIGDSYLKVNPNTIEDNADSYPPTGYNIWAFNVTNHNSARSSSQKGKAFIISGQHAREYGPPELTLRFAEMLLFGFGQDVDITWLLNHVEVHFVFHV